MRTFFKSFDIEEKRAHRILAELIVDIQATCMCQKCGIHPLEDPAVELVLTNERQYQDNEHRFTIYALAHLLLDSTIWEAIYKYVPFDLGKEFAIKRIEDLFDSLYKERISLLQ